MNDNSRREDGPTGKAVKIECDLTIENVASLKLLLMTSLKERDGLVIDLGGIAAVDVAGLQLLCSAHKATRLMNKEFALAGNLPEAFRQAVTESGYARNDGCAGECLWIEGETNG